jgi:hypothetical protein
VSVFLEATAAEIEGFVGQSGWDQRPSLFALVNTAQFVRDEPSTATRLGLNKDSPDGLTPIEQADLPDEPLDDVLAQLGWPESVAGCAISQEIVILPPSAETELEDDNSAPGRAAQHPERREARLVVAVLRDGSSAALLRLRGGSDNLDELLTGPDLAPNLVDALLLTLRGD